MQPPYRGVLATMVGMTWARGAIFYCSDIGKSFMTNTLGSTNTVLNTAVPPMVIGTLVQVHVAVLHLQCLNIHFPCLLYPLSSKIMLSCETSINFCSSKVRVLPVIAIDYQHANCASYYHYSGS